MLLMVLTNFMISLGLGNNPVGAASLLAEATAEASRGWLGHQSYLMPLWRLQKTFRAPNHATWGSVAEISLHSRKGGRGSPTSGGGTGSPDLQLPSWMEKTKNTAGILDQQE